MSRLNATVLSFLVLSCAQPAPVPHVEGALRDVVFDRYSPYSRNQEIARRTLTPLTLRYGQQMLETTGQAFREQPVDLTQEKFTLYVPGVAPKDGYGLLVFIAPWNEATRPQLWRLPMDRHGL